MRVLRIIGEIGKSLGIGPAKQAYLLTKGLAEKGVESIVLTFNCQEELKKIPKVRVLEYKPSFRLGHMRFNFKIIKDSFLEKFDIIHVHGYRNIQTEFGSILSLIRRKPLVITTHGTVLGYKYAEWNKFQNKLYDLLTLKFSLFKANIIVATSKFEEKELIEFGIDRRKIRVIYNAIEEMPYLKKEKEKEEKIILTVSRLTYKNNLELAIKAFARALKFRKDIKYVIVGEEKPSRYVKEEFGYKNKLVKLCKELNIEDKVEFKGFLTDYDLWSIYAKADLFLWTSRYDNFAHALVEAAHFGLPIISTPVGIAEELIEENRGGKLVGYDEEEIALAIIEVLERKDLDKISKHNEEKAKLFSLDKMVESYYSLYLELCRK